MRLVVSPLHQQRGREHVQREPENAPVDVLAQQLRSGRQQRDRLVVVAKPAPEPARVCPGHAQRQTASVRAGSDSLQRIEHRAEGLGASRHLAVDHEEEPERGAGDDEVVEHPSLDSPFPRNADVPLVTVDLAQGRGLVTPGQHVFQLAQHPQVVVAVPVADPRMLRLIAAEHLVAELTQQAVHAIAAVLRAHQHRFVDQRRQDLHGGPADALGSRKREALFEDRQSLPRRLLLGGQSLPRRDEDGTHAPVPFRLVPVRRGQEIDVLANAVRDLRQREGIGPGGRQIERQRHAVDQPADVDHLGALLVPQGVPTAGAPQAVHEQLDRLVSLDVIRLRPLGHAQALDRVNPLAAEVQPLAARCQQGQIRDMRQHRRDEIQLIDQLFEVVEHQHHRALAEPRQQLPIRRVLAPELQPKLAGDGPGHLIGVSGRGQLHEAGDAGKPVGHHGRDVQG